MAALTNTQISVTYVGLLKTSASTVLSSTAQQITDGSGNNSILYLSTAGVGIGAAAAAGKELDVTGNVLVTGDLQVDNINIDGNTISATSGVVTLANGAIATTQSQNDNSTKIATTAYVDTAIDGVDTLAEILAIGNTTGGTDIAVSANDDITFTSSSKAIFGPSTDLQIYSDGSNNYIDSTSNELRIRSNDLRLLNYGTAKYITADNGADVSLYHNDSKKFETTSAGVTVTGEINATGVYKKNGEEVIGQNSTELRLANDTYWQTVKLYTNGTARLTLDNTQATFAGSIIANDTSKIEKAQVTTQFDTSSFLRLHPSATTNSGGFTNMIFGTDTANNFGVAIGGKRAGTDGTPSFVVRMLNDDVTGTEVLNILDTTTTTFTTSTFNISKGSGAVKLEFGQTNGNWKIEAGNSGNNTLIIGSVSNATNNITLDTTNGGSATFSGDVTINRASNPTKLQIGSSLADDPFIVFQTDGNTMSMGIDRSDSNKFVISDNATLGTNNRFTIDSSGNVGIGSSPDRRLHVNSGTDNANTIFESTDTAVTVRFKDSTGETELECRNDWRFSNNAGADERMRIDSAGNLLVGSQSFQNGAFGGSATGINVAGVQPLVLLHETDTDKDGYIGISGSTMFIQTADAIPIRFGTSDTERMRIDSSGNLGLGTDNPSSYNSNADNLVINESGDFTGITLAADNDQGSNIYFADPDDDNVGGITYNHTSNYMMFRVNGAEKMRVNNTGEIQIGGTTNAGFIDFDSNNLQLNTQRNPNTGSFVNTGKSHATIGLQGADGGSKIIFGTNASNNATATTRMTITDDGSVLIGTTTNQGIGGVSIDPNSDPNPTITSIVSNTSVSGAELFVARYNNTQVGSISLNGTTGTNFNTSSDYRLKENVVEMTDALNRVSQLKPSRFNFIADEDKTVDGFLAHEVQDIVPEAITGEKDGMRTEEYEESPAVYEEIVHEAQEEIEWEDKPTMDNTKVEIQEWLDDNNIEWQSADTKQELLDRIPEYQQEAQEESVERVLVSEAVMATREVPVYQGIDQSKLVPLLVGAIQELKARIEVLENS